MGHDPAHATTCPSPYCPAPPTLRPTITHATQHHSANHQCSETHQHASLIIHASIQEDAPLAVEGGEFIGGGPREFFLPHQFLPDFCTSPRKTP